MNAILARQSLSHRVFVALIAGEVLFAVVLGLTMGAFSSLTLVQQRAMSLRQISATIAAGLMPMVADQQEPQVRAQLASIVEAAAVQDVIGICLEDSSGAVIAATGDWDPTAAEHDRMNASPWSVLVDEQLVEQPVVVHGLTVAVTKVHFAAPGIGVLKAPTIASLVILLSVMLVSLPWTAWRLMRDVTEPLADLKSYAARIADGEWDTRIGRDGYGEIRELQETLDAMARQLRDRDEQLRASYEDLSGAYRALEDANEAVKQLSAVKSNFVAVAAHELRGPLTTIRLYAEILDTSEPERLGQPAGDAVAAILSASSRLTSIVHDLMDSALLERGLMPIQFGDVWLGALVEDATRDAAMIARAKAIDVSVGETPESLVYGDSLRLRQVLDNLLSNAIKYSPANSRIEVRVSEIDGWAVVEVVDQGRGIPAGGEQELFALFGRLDFGDSRDTAGLGLGLAISARIAEAHGGRITYSANQGGRGSVFSLRIPLRSSEADSAAGTAYIDVMEDGDAA